MSIDDIDVAELKAGKCSISAFDDMLSRQTDVVNLVPRRREC
jgi:hypothetical protein